MAKTYPSRNRAMMQAAILEDVADWKKLQDELEIQKAKKKMRMLYAHLLLYDIKMQEVRGEG